MAKEHTPEAYWPLAALEYSHEIAEDFPEEAQLLGTITILWNGQEIALRRLFIWILRAKRDEYAEAIWDRQPTHKARRDLLALALDAAKLTKRQKNILTWVIDDTKKLADRRNDLIHAEYVVSHRTDKLHAKVKSPRSKEAKHQPASASDLSALVDELDWLVRATESAALHFHSRKLNRLLRELDRIAAERKQSPENQQSDFRPQSPRRKRRAAPPPPPQS